MIRVRGAGRAFCPGYDLAPSSGYSAVPQGRTGARHALADLGESPIARDRESLREMIDRWLWMWNYRKPIIAQTHGYCLSGGLDLIGACDIVFAAEGTLFGHPAARGMGIPVTLGMMPLKIGAAATKELLFTGDTIDAAEAARIGLIAHVVPADELDERVAAFCQRVALNPLDVLTVHKHVTNRWSEVMNVRLAAFEGAEYDSIAHMTPSMGEFSRRAQRGRPAGRARLARRAVHHRPGRRARRGGAPSSLTRRRRRPDGADPAHVGHPRRRSGRAHGRRRRAGRRGARPRRRRRRARRRHVRPQPGADRGRPGAGRRPGRASASRSSCCRATTTASCRGRSGARVELPANVHVMTDPDGEQVDLDALDLRIWGRPHPDYLDMRPLADLPPRDGHTWHVALAHGHMVLGEHDLHRAYLITPEEIAASERDYIALGHWDVPHDMSAGDVTAAYSGSASRYRVCALVTLTLDDDTRRVDVERLDLPEP